MLLLNDFLDRLLDLVECWCVLSHRLELNEELFLAAVQLVDTIIQMVHLLRGHTDLVLEVVDAFRDLPAR